MDKPSIQAEVSLIGNVLVDPEGFDRVRDLVSAEEFFDPRHAVIWNCIGSMVEPVDIVTLSEALERAGKLDAAGGLAYLGTIRAGTSAAANTRAYAKAIRDHALLRALIRTGAAQVDAVHNPNGRTAQELLAESQRALESLSFQRSSGWVSAGDATTSAIDRIETLLKNGGGMVGVSTGFRDLDKKTRGLEPGTLTIIAARPSQGKTTLAIQIARHVAETDPRHVAVFSLEMSAESLAIRMMSALGGVDHDRLRSAQLGTDDYEGVTRAASRLGSMRLHIDDTSGLTSDEIQARAKRLHRETGGLSLIVIDYLGLIGISSKSESHNLAIGKITADMKGLAKTLNIPVVLLSQLNRGLEQRPNKRPTLADLRDCLPVDEWVDTPTGPVQLQERPETVVAVGANGPIVSRADFVEKRYNRVYRVRTQFGDFRATARHQVLTGTGWKQVRELVPGRDVIASPRIIPHANRGHQPHARLLGWLLGNGSLSGTPSLVYRHELHDDVVQAVKPFGVRVNVRSRQKSPNVYECYLSQGVETGSLENPLMAWLRDLGLDGKRSAERFIPAKYLGSSTDTHLDLLRGLWETDGSVSYGSARFSTTSEVLARQVRWLLLTIGVRSRMTCYARSGVLPLWTVRSASADNERMAPIVSFQVRFGELSHPSRFYEDFSPALFTEIAAEYAGKHRRFQKRINGGLKRLSKSELKEVNIVPIPLITESPFMTLPCVGWGDVLSVELEEDKDVRVCDLHVPNDHCFVVNGVVVHNSGSIEQDADLVMFIYRDEVYYPDSQEAGIAEIIIGKQRNGPIGTTRVAFKGELCRFADLAYEWRAPAPQKRYDTEY